MTLAFRGFEDDGTGAGRSGALCPPTRSLMVGRAGAAEALPLGATEVETRLGIEGGVGEGSLNAGTGGRIRCVGLAGAALGAGGGGGGGSRAGAGFRSKVLLMIAHSTPK